MDLFDLGAVSWWESQCFYHALATLNKEALLICHPAPPNVCLGNHDDLEYEIDQDTAGSRRYHSCAGKPGRASLSG